MSDVWFVRKSFGWGWTPSTWHGWLSLVVYGVFVGCIIARFLSATTDTTSVLEIVLTFVMPLCVATGVLITLCYKKGESPRWQWGSKK